MKKMIQFIEKTAERKKQEKQGIKAGNRKRDGKRKKKVQSG
jgi:hypothetical protein